MGRNIQREEQEEAMQEKDDGGEEGEIGDEGTTLRGSFNQTAKMHIFSF